MSKRTRRLSVLSIVIAGLLPGVASANVTDVAVRVALLDAPEECAVEVEVESVEGDLFNGNEALQFNGMTVATFSPLLSSRSNISSGTRILFGSPAFRAAVGAETDIDLTDEDCATLEAGTEVGFLGSFGPEAASLTLPSGFSLRKFVDPSGTLTDLEVVGVLLRNSLGNEISIGGSSSGGDAGTGGGGGSGGGGTGGGDASCGCRVPGAGSGSAGTLSLATAGLLLVLSRRRRRRRAHAA